MLIAVPHCQEGTMRLNIKPKQKSWYVMVCTVGLSFRQDVTVVILQLKFKPFCHISVPLKTAVQSDSVTLSSSLCWSVPRGHYLVFPTKYCFLLPSLSPCGRGRLEDLKSVTLVSPFETVTVFAISSLWFKEHLNHWVCFCAVIL